MLSSPVYGLGMNLNTVQKSKHNTTLNTSLRNWSQFHYYINILTSGLKNESQTVFVPHFIKTLFQVYETVLLCLVRFTNVTMCEQKISAANYNV